MPLAVRIVDRKQNEQSLRADAHRHASKQKTTEWMKWRGKYSKLLKQQQRYQQRRHRSKGPNKIFTIFLKPKQKTITTIDEWFGLDPDEVAQYRLSSPCIYNYTCLCIVSPAVGTMKNLLYAFRFLRRTKNNNSNEWRRRRAERQTKVYLQITYTHTSTNRKRSNKGEKKILFNDECLHNTQNILVNSVLTHTRSQTRLICSQFDFEILCIWQTMFMIYVSLSLFLFIRLYWMVHIRQRTQIADWRRRTSYMV